MVVFAAFLAIDRYCLMAVKFTATRIISDSRLQVWATGAVQFSVRIEWPRGINARAISKMT